MSDRAVVELQVRVSDLLNRVCRLEEDRAAGAIPVPVPEPAAVPAWTQTIAWHPATVRPLGVADGTRMLVVALPNRHMVASYRTGEWYDDSAKSYRVQVRLWAYLPQAPL